MVDMRNMRKVIDWINSHAIYMIIIMVVLCSITAILREYDVIPMVYIGKQPLEGILFLILIGFVLFLIVIFIPIYRIFGISTIRIIKKGKHYPHRTHLPVVLSLRDKFKLSRTFIFNETCLYDFDDQDEYDKNKLFGISFVIFPRIKTEKWLKNKQKNNETVLIWFKLLGLIFIKPHHWSSARFSWNTVNTDDKIDVYPYIYDEGVRITFNKMQSCVLNRAYRFGIDISKGTVIFSVKDRKTKENDMTPYYMGNIGITFYYLDLYFGGNKKAPHDIMIEEYNS